MYKRTGSRHFKVRKAIAFATAFATMVCMTLSTASAFADTEIEKDESVYVITDSTGAQNEVIVSDHLKNGPQLDKIEDKSDLKDIENVKGDETFKQSGEKLTWNAGGNDIYYQGKTTKEVPVTLNVKYYLDGQEVSGKELDGKSGNVTIRIKYENNSSVNGTKVPFIVMTGFIVEDDCMKNITVDHGKVIDDGEKQIVVGMAAPGLTEDLDLEGEDIGMGDSVTIKGKAKDFAVEDMMTIVTNSVFNDINTSKFDDMDYDDEINELDKGSKALVDGSNQLYKGITKLSNNMPELEDGVDQLKNGADQVHTGSISLHSGAKQLKDGSALIYKGICAVKVALGTGDKKNLAKNPGLKNVLGQVEGGITSIGSNMDNAVLLVEGLTKQVDGINSYLTAAQSELGQVDLQTVDLSGAVEEIDNDIAAINADPVLTNEQKEALVGTLENAKENVSGAQDFVNSNVATNLTHVKTAQGAISGAQTLIGSETTESSALYNLGLLSKIVQGVDAAANGELLKGIKGAETINNTVLANLGDKKTKDTLIKGAYDLSGGTSAVESGSKELEGGAKQLADGMESLQSNSGKLADGVDQLDSGSKKLSNGMSKLYNEGIKKIVDLYKDDLKGLTNGLSDMKDATKGYKVFTELPSDMDGNTKFIYKTTICEK